VEAASVFEELALSGRDVELVNQNKWGWPENWRRARLLSAVDYVQIDRFRRQVVRQMHKMFEDVDVVFGPTYGSFDLIIVTNFTGQPGLTLRAGFTESPSRSGASFNAADPKGRNHTITRNVTFHGRLFEEGKMLALGRALESKLGVWQRHPVLK
jgi:Asp-tRNA(Asn)/Glu-tRNA(Gln) amidotransferase A subunit family amidase